MSSLFASYTFRHKYIHSIKRDYPDAFVDINFGSELATVTVKGNADDVENIENLIEEYKSKLCHRRITVSSAEFQLLDSRKSRAFTYVFSRTEKKLLCFIIFK